MSYVKRTLRELNVMDDFLMNAVASDEEVGEEFCRRMVSTLLNRNVGEVRVISQKGIQGATPELRGVRLDVEVVEPVITAGEKFPSMNIYDVEPHLRDDMHLARRNRFYQAKMDGRYVRSGLRDFSKLHNLYIITITPYDPFGYGYMMYTVENRCREVPTLPYDDGLQFIYFNSVGTKGGNSEIRQMLKYFQDSRKNNVTNDTLEAIHRCVERVKRSPEMEWEFMTIGEWIDYHREDAAREARQEAQIEREKAVRERQIKDICELLEDYGEIPAGLKERVAAETDAAVLKRWLKLAARSGSMEEFIRRMDKG